MYLYHYFEKAKGPLLSLSALPSEQADDIQNKLVADNETFAAQRNERYLPRRRELEKLVHKLFVEKGGKPEKGTPHYLVIGECPWFMTWYEQTDFIKIPISERIVSEAINNGGGQNGVGEYGFPFVKSKVSSNNSGFTFGTHREMGEKQFATFSVE